MKKLKTRKAAMQALLKYAAARKQFTPFLEDKEFVLEALELNEFILPFVKSKILKDDEDVILKATKLWNHNISRASDRLKDDREFIIQVIKECKGIYVYQGISERLKNDKEIILLAIKHDSDSIWDASEEIINLCKDKDPIEVLTKAIKSEKLHAELEQELSLPTTQQTIPKKLKKL